MLNRFHITVLNHALHELCRHHSHVFLTVLFTAFF
ncbi:hypothetical protein LINPERHAP1_LOCUS12622 [Linum perenne]